MKREETHVWCELCKKIQPAIVEGLEFPGGAGDFLGGDIVCAECASVIATIYKRDLK